MDVCPLPLILASLSLSLIHELMKIFFHIVLCSHSHQSVQCDIRLHLARLFELNYAMDFGDLHLMLEEEPEKVVMAGILYLLHQIGH